MRLGDRGARLPHDMAQPFDFAAYDIKALPNIVRARAKKPRQHGEKRLKECRGMFASPFKSAMGCTMLQQSSITTDLLVATLSPEAMESILDKWAWLIGIEKRPLLVTACGDVFIEDLLERTIQFLDTSAPVVTLVTETRQQFEMLLAEPSFVETYLHPNRVEMLRGKGLFLKKDQVYSFSTPLSLGGQISADNIAITDVDVHFAVAGQIECQIADIPVGTPVTGIKINRMPSKKMWWKFW